MSLAHPNLIAETLKAVERTPPRSKRTVKIPGRNVLRELKRSYFQLFPLHIKEIFSTNVDYFNLQNLKLRLII